MEIDETKYFHRKCHRGRYRDGQWVFGGVERESGNCFLVAVSNRKTDTLFPLIQEWILPGTRVVSDSWAGYATIEQRSQGALTHAAVNHSLNFVDPQDPSIHMNRIENVDAR